MFKIYIKDFNKNGQCISNETLIQTVPASSENELRFISPIVKCEMGKVEGFDFSIEPGTPFYDALLQMKTFIRVVYDDETIFYGRVLTIDNSGFRGTRKIRCEGPLSFLMDSPVEGVEETKRKTISTYEYIQQLISNHNAYINNEENKRFAVGNVPGNYSGVNAEQQIKNDSRKFGSDSWTDTKSALEDLRSHYGGFLRTRAGAIGSPIYLDWLNHYFNPNTVSQKIEVGKNILDISNITEIDNVFTAIIPIGRRSVSKSDTGNSSSSQENLYIDGKILRVPDIVSYFDSKGVSLNSGYHTRSDYENAINKYGMIIKTVSLTDSSTKEKLYEDACEWIRNNYQGEVTKFTIKALDMHMIEGITGVNTSKIMVGDRVEIKYPVGKEDGSFEMRTTTQTCLSISYDLYHPENTSYTFGIPANILTKTYGIRKKAGSVSSASTQKSVNSGIGPGRDYDWLDVAGGWLMDHLQYYNPPSKKTTNIPKYYPYPMDDSYANYMYGPQLYHPNNHTLIYAEPGAVVDGRKSWHGSIQSFENFDYETIEKYHVCEYVLYEYGIDIRTQLTYKGQSVTYPGMTVDSKGNMTFWKTAFNQITGRFEKVKSVFAAFGEALTDHLIDYYSPDGEQIHAYMGADGDWHYYYTDPETHEKVETTVRDLKIEQLYDDKRIGWVVKENDQGDFEFADPGIMTLTIEDYCNGPLVTARMSGEVMYLGNYKTQTYYSTSLNHMSQVCGDVEYVTDTSVPGDKRMVIHSGAGVRTYHAVIDPETGQPVIDPATGKIKYAEFGLYDNNTLTGGMITDHLADGTVTTAIKGDIIDISATQVKAGSYSNVESWLAQNGVDISNVSGLLADTITAYEGRFGNIEADKIDADNINTKMQNVSRLVVKELEGNVYASKLYFANGSTPYGSTIWQKVSDGIAAVQIDGPTNNVYTLQYKRYSDSDWQNASPGTFSRAVTSWVDEWNTNNGSIKVTAKPQNQPHTVTTNLRFEGTGAYHGFDAAIGTVDSGGNFTRKYKKDAYLTLDSSGSAATVSVRSEDNVLATQYASLSVASVWSNGYNSGLPNGISIGSLTYQNPSWSHSDATSLSSFGQSSIWSNSSYANTYGYLSFPVTVHGHTKTYYFSFDNRKMSSGGNTAYGAGYGDGQDSVRNKIGNYGTVSQRGGTTKTYKASDNGWEGISQITVSVSGGGRSISSIGMVSTSAGSSAVSGYSWAGRISSYNPGWLKIALSDGTKIYYDVG